MKRIIYTVDVEKDLHSNTYKGITEGLKRFEILCDNPRIKPILFVTCDCIEKHPEIFRKLHKKGWEISLHAYRHERFDELNLKEKEEALKKSILCFKKHLNIKPKGFRAPQHSIDDETLDLLEKHGFEYDSSYTPLNFLQLVFFPKKLNLWAKTTFSSLNPYKIRKNLLELPPSSFFVPFVSLTLRIFPKFLLKPYVGIISSICKKPMFYAHSWDFIELKKSRVDRTFPYTKFLDKLDYVMSLK